MSRLFAAAVLAAFSFASHAAESGEPAVRAAIESLVPGAKIESIAESVVGDFYEVTIDGRVVYVSADGRYLLQGSIYDIPNKQDITEVSRAGVRQAALKDVGDDMRIVFAPENPKHKVTVFTDIDCGYCRRMHEQVPEYNRLGISIEYLFFPRAGAGSASWDKAVSVWCSDDRQQALTDAKAGKELDRKECTNPVGDEYATGQKIGISGTPAVIAADGTQLGGYVPPEQLLQRLDELAAK